MSFTKSFEVRWADLDPNLHMRHTAYNDYAAHMRVSALAEVGFSLERFQSLKMGPVLFRETTEYLKEVRAGEIISANVLLGGLSECGRKWRVIHEICKADEAKSAVVTVDGAWFNILTRKVVPAPAELLEALNRFPRSPSYQILP